MIDQLIACAASPVLAGFLYSCPNISEPAPIKISLPVVLEARRIPISAAESDVPISPIAEIPLLPPEDIPLPVVGSTEALEILISMIEADTQSQAPSPAELRFTEKTLEPFGGRGPVVRDGVFARLLPAAPLESVPVETASARKLPKEEISETQSKKQIQPKQKSESLRLGLKTGF